jgi:magnesium-transporting ATPase (P-type)
MIVVNAAELVPGDLVTLNDGDQVPADICLVKASEFKVRFSFLFRKEVPEITKRGKHRETK